MEGYYNSARFYPLYLRGFEEGYTFTCMTDGCRGKSEKQPLPENCPAFTPARRVAVLKLTDKNILTQLIRAECVRIER